MQENLRETITQLGLDYRLMTQFTSFVAVEQMVVTDGGVPRRIDVPIEMPAGVSREGVFGKDETDKFSNFPSAPMARAVNIPSGTLQSARSAKMLPPPKPSPGIASGKGRNAGVGAGGGGAVGGQARVSRSVIMADAAEPERKLSPGEEMRRVLLEKLHPSILAVIDRLKDSKAKPGADEARFIHDGKAEIQIWLTDKSVENLAKLKELGFEVMLDPKTSNLVIGRMPVEKLAMLSDLKFVRYVAPQLAGG
jgi:Ca-activated chloride channel family protein